MTPTPDSQDLTPTERQLALELDLLGWAVPSMQFQVQKFTGTVDPRTVPRNRDRSRDEANARRGVATLTLHIQRCREVLAIIRQQREETDDSD